MIEYIVGIDFGHGETSAWVVPINEENSGMLNWEGSSLLLKSSNDVQKRTIPSEVYFRDNEYSLNGSSKSAVITQMKDKPSELNAKDRNNNYTNEKRKPYERYIRCVVLSLLELNESILHKEERNFILCMASPTSWTEVEKKEYLKFFNEAIADLGLSFEWIINESDAAFFSKIEKLSNRNDSCLVIDYGSSTIDYTLMKNSKKESDNGWSNRQFGASRIEDAMINAGHDEYYEEIILKTTKFLNQHNLKYIKVEEWIKKKCRELKEEKYTNKDDNFEFDFAAARFISEIRNGETMNSRFNWCGNLSEVTAEYREKVKQDIISLRGNIKEKIHELPKHVILSGGACIMFWFRKLVKELFPESNIIIDDTPSFVVSQGIALYARTQYQAITDLQKNIEIEDFASMYKKADAKAYHQAISQLCPKVVDALAYSAPITGKEIRDRFCNFIKDLGPSNSNYCQLVQQYFDNALKNSVGNTIKSAVRNAFGVEVDISNIEVHVPIEVLDWNPSNFNPGGGWYNYISGAIDNYYKWNSFNFEKTRDYSKVRKIAEGVKNEIQNFDLESGVTYPDDVVKAFAEQIKKVAIQQAMNIFYEKQLFTTTFSA